MIVVTTNILAYRFIPNARDGDAALLAEIDPHWAAPLLWRSELRNVLTGYLRRETHNQLFAEQARHFASRALVAGEHKIEGGAVFDLVQRSTCTSSDCEFVALAIRLNTFLATEDRELLRAFPDRCRNLIKAIRFA